MARASADGRDAVTVLEVRYYAEGGRAGVIVRRPGERPNVLARFVGTHAENMASGLAAAIRKGALQPPRGGA